MTNGHPDEDKEVLLEIAHDFTLVADGASGAPLPVRPSSWRWRRGQSPEATGVTGNARPTGGNDGGGTDTGRVQTMHGRADAFIGPSMTEYPVDQKTGFVSHHVNKFSN